ncbi:hypothetical protein [Adlercreutzia sp. ZJ154]|uniref:hypothetical protein n=1 Tax=Adlercreutzia sp. ZJ154 TaxID=2709790 RepID=UPI0013EAF18D|nr:hypothetical protein [Adlercreutzia sp. ZJ154]
MDKEMELMSAQRRRAGNAVIAIAVLAMVFIAACMLSSKAEAEGLEDTFVEHVWDGLKEDKSITDVLQETNLRSVPCNELPNWFSDEIAQPEQGWDIWIVDDWSVIGIICDSRASELQAYIKTELSKNGWVECSSGEEGVSTYVKDGGACKWIMVEFAQTGELGSVVLHTRQD